MGQRNLEVATMRFRGVLTGILVVGLSLGTNGLTAYCAVTDDVVTQADGLIQQARKDGLDYLNSKDDKTKKSAKKALDEAEKLLKKAVKDDPACEKCFEMLTSTYFYQTYFGFAKDYDDCLKAASNGL